MNPCTLTTYLHNFTWPTFPFRKSGRHFSNNTIKKGNLLLGNCIEMKHSRHRVFKAVQNTRCTRCLKRLHRSLMISRLLISLRTDVPPSLRKNRERSLLSRFFLREEGTSVHGLLLVGRYNCSCDMADESTVHGNKAMVMWFDFHSLISRAIFGGTGNQAVNVIAFCGFSWVLKNGEQFSMIGTLIDHRWCGQNKF